jgi:multidrug efflux pump subunit AcrA (membrane-fusion protein)
MVRPGQLLAAEAAPARGAAARADRAQIQADKANLAALMAEGSGAAGIASAEAKLARDRARRAADLMKLVATQILAPKPGTVVAIYGQPGETVTPAGLRGAGAQGRAALMRQPRFALVPSGPMASVRSRGMALPVIALRTSGGWQVRLLIPQTSTSAVRVGQTVTISVPGAGLTGVRGTVEELSPVPVGTSGSAAYEVTVGVRTRTQITPLSGMTADVQLGSLSGRTLHGGNGGRGVRPGPR